MHKPAVFTAAALLALLAFLCIGLARELSPQRQVEQKTRALLDAAADRNWRRAAKLVAEDYRDQWGHTKADALALAQELGIHFFSLELIPAANATVSAGSDRGRWTGKIRARGEGSAVATALLQAAAELQEDFVFDWKRESWEPWSWRLTSVAQPEIPQIP